MQAYVLPLLAVDMDLSFSLKPLLFMAFRVALLAENNVSSGLHNVVGRPGGNALGKFALMIGKKRPMGILLAQGIRLNPGAIQRAIIGPVSSAEYQSKVFYRILIFTGIGRIGKKKHCQNRQDCASVG